MKCLQKLFFMVKRGRDCLWRSNYMIPFAFWNQLFSVESYAGFSVNIISYVSLLMKNQIFGPVLKLAREPCFWDVLAIVWGQAPESRQNDFWTVQNQIFGPDPKITRAPCFWILLAIVLGQEPEMVENGFLEVPKTRYSAETPYLEHSIA